MWRNGEVKVVVEERREERGERARKRRLHGARLIPLFLYRIPALGVGTGARPGRLSPLSCQ